MNYLTKESLIKLKEYLDNKDEKVSATIVMISNKTGVDYTYKIKGYMKNSFRVASISIENDYNNFVTVFYVYNNNIITPKTTNTTSKNKKGAIWLLTNLINNNFDFILNNYKLAHTGRCIKCNRILTDKDSIEYGMGTKCRNN